MCVDSLQQKLAGINENDATSTNFTSNPTERNSEMAKEIPFFCGFIKNDNTVTPDTTTNDEQDLSYWNECVDPNLNPMEELLVSLESRDDEEDDSIF